MGPRRAGRGATAGKGPLVLVSLRSSSVEPLYRQIYRDVRQRILDGELAAGGRLPSSRSLAQDLCVSRSTVALAYGQLEAEGYLETSERGATRVSRNLPDAHTRAEATGGRRPAQAIAPPSRRGRTVAAAWPHFPPISDRPARAFRISVPALDVFPSDVWGRLAARRWRRTPAVALAYGDSRGLPALRRATADYLTRARGARCLPEQVLVTAGSQAALSLAAQVLLDPGDEVWLEDPGYFGAGAAFLAAGARCVGIPVDAEGLDVAEGIRRAPEARLAFVTPARQMPLGVTMSLPRRLALLDWAASHRAWIIEDDYDSEFRYGSRPLATLQGVDERGCVILTGTFSKVLFPALRLGYLVAPEPLMATFAEARRFLDCCPPYLTQAVMADFLEGGHFERHIRRMRAIYRFRRELLVDLLRGLGPGVEVEAADAGMSLVLWLPASTRDVLVSRALQEAGIDALPLSACVLERRLRPGLLLGYSGIRPSELRDGVKRLASVLRRVGII